MTVSKSQLIASAKYRAKTYDRVSIEVKKGVREEWKQAAAARGITYTEMIRDSVEEYIRNHPPIKKE